MGRPRILWLLRIAVSAVFGILCLALIALWVRSYSWQDYYRVRSGNRDWGHLSGRGWVDGNFHSRDPWGFQTGALQLETGSNFVEDWSHGQSPMRGWRWDFASRIPLGTSFGITVPHWFLVLLAVVASALPWIGHNRWRFSLRALLLAMTLVAVVLGLIVALR